MQKETLSTTMKTQSQLCDIPRRVHSFIENDKKRKKEVGSTWEAAWIFRCRISNVLRSSHHLLLFTNQLLSYFFLPSLELGILGLLAGDNAAGLGSKVPAPGCCTLASVTVGTARMPQVTAVPGMFRKPASWTSRPVHSADDFRVSNCFFKRGAKAILVHPDYLNDAHGGPPLGAVARLLASEVKFSISVDRNSIVCLVADLLIRFSFSYENEVLLWSSLIRSLLGGHLSNHQQGLKMF